MRVTDSLIRAFVARSNQDIKAEIFDAGRKVTTGKAVATPADDPVRAARVVRMTRLIRRLDAIDNGHQRVVTDLSVAENAMSQMVQSLGLIKGIGIQMASETMSANDRAIAAQDVIGFRDQLLNMANREQDDGRHLFAGVAEGQPPYDTAGNFQGSTVSRRVEIAPGVFVDGNILGFQSFGDAGNEVFKDVDALITALQADDTTGIQDSLNVLDDRINAGSVNLAAIGSRLRVMDDTENITQDLRLQYLFAKSAAEDVDITEEITRYSAAETNLAAVIEVTRRLLSQSLSGILR